MKFFILQNDNYVFKKKKKLRNKFFYTMENKWLNNTVRGCNKEEIKGYEYYYIPVAINYAKISSGFVVDKTIEIIIYFVLRKNELLVFLFSQSWDPYQVSFSYNFQCFIGVTRFRPQISKNDINWVSIYFFRYQIDLKPKIFFRERIIFIPYYPK